MDHNKLRNHFINFFKKNKHFWVPPSPIVNKNDPSLMFTNAGMNQFKSIFLGIKEPKEMDVMNSQLCLRVSGKHNDLEEVGVDTYHHTLFEMLGNWSFGNYFKERAINLAWEFLTKELALSKDRIYITIFEGNKIDNLKPDNESFKIWSKYIEKDKIIFCPKSDNFWEMGQTGPCGPCSEIHFDIRPQKERDKIDGKDLVNKGNPFVIEIWNLVFITFNRLENGKLLNLDNHYIDTGLGFERLLMILQNKSSTYETDIFQNIIKCISKKTKKYYGTNKKVDIAMRVVADHIRAVSIVISQGTIPSNTQEGYVIRRILRRAIRYAYSYLDIYEPFIYKLVPIIFRDFEYVIPNIKKQELSVQRIIENEEKSFLKTLGSGLKILNDIIKNSNRNIIDGKTAFELYDTYGFPFDLTSLIAKEKNYGVDIDGFKVEMDKQKNRSKNSSIFEESPWIVISPSKDTIFEFHDKLETQSKILQYKKVINKDSTFYKIIFDKTPFYPEGGGQVGDNGTIITDYGEEIEILNTKKENDNIIHFTNKLPKKLKNTFLIKVNKKRRKLISNNHTATHLLHAALCQVLGNHITQKGSFLNDKLLRFDFNHFGKLNYEEIHKIENIVNQKIRKNIFLEEKREITKQKALEMNAKALFGEKYSNNVRVIIFDKNYSIELCGGTHAKSTGELGYFKIVSECSVSTGIRRIEAVTAKGFDEYINSKLSVLASLDKILKHPKDIVKNLSSLIEDKQTLEKNLKKLSLNELKEIKKKLSSKVKVFENSKITFNYVIEYLEMSDMDNLKTLAFQLKKEYSPLFLILAVKIKDKPFIIVLIDDTLINKFKLNAGMIIKSLSKHIEGNGGGQPFFATAGGKNLKGLQEVIKEGKEFKKYLF